MWFTGTLLNALTVLAGGLIGTTAGARLPQRVWESIVRGVGLFTIAMGAKFAIDTANLLYLLFAILLGGLIGSFGELDRRLNALGAAIERRVEARRGRGEGGLREERADSGDAGDVDGPTSEGRPTRGNVAGPSRRGSLAEGFVTATIVFCVGPLTFLGSIQNGLTGDATLLVIKSVLDGFTAIALAATLGWGVLLSIVVILVYQGGLAAGATLFAGLLSPEQLREMNATGGLLILGVGLRLLRIRDVAVADYLPAIVVAPLLVALAARFGAGP